MLKAIAAAGLVVWLCQAGPTPELVAVKVDQLPALDGKADDAAWGKAQELVVKIDLPSELEKPRKQISLKAVHDGTTICFLLVWDDKLANTEHRPWVWN